MLQEAPRASLSESGNMTISLLTLVVLSELPEWRTIISLGHSIPR